MDVDFRHGASMDLVKDLVKISYRAVENVTLGGSSSHL
jgi:hypothetical protein